MNAAGALRFQWVESSLQKRRPGFWLELLWFIAHGEVTGSTLHPVVRRVGLCAGLEPALEGVLLRSLYALTQLRRGLAQASQLGMAPAD